MGVTYFKRFRMQIRLDRVELPAIALAPGYRLTPWDPLLEPAHAEAKYRSFREEIDANVFPSLAGRDGCRRLMKEIARRSGFVPQATWLAVCDGDPPDYCGTIQGVHDDEYRGWIQNLGIAPEHRGRQLGSGLLIACLDGFRQTGIDRVLLEVTAHNWGAIRLYERLGFRKIKTCYKASQYVLS